MLFYPNVKINLGLRIKGKRADGYHNLESIFLPILGLADILEIVPAEFDSFTITGLPIEGSEESNLIFKALQLLRSERQIGGCHIHLHKLIPMGAGLGGGSSDGAFALKALNQVFDLGYSIKELQEKAAVLGSDCPFFIENKPAKVSGRGEILEPFTGSVMPKNLWISIVHPGIHISTKEAFAALDLSTQFPFEYPLPIELGTDWKAWNRFYQNHFQNGASTHFPIIATLLSELKALNSEGFTSMTGSGSACFQISGQEINLSNFRANHYFTWQGKI